MNNICSLCGKPKKTTELPYWLHWKCIDKLKEFVNMKYGNENQTWGTDAKKKYLEEYLIHQKKREKVEFT